jgi:hypothetical protein
MSFVALKLVLLRGPGGESDVPSDEFMIEIENGFVGPSDRISEL